MQTIDVTIKHNMLSVSEKTFVLGVRDHRRLDG